MYSLTKITSLAAVIMLVSACGSGSVNDNIRIAKGEIHEGGARSVNGNIIVGSKATVQGDISSVNGTVDIDDGAEVANIKSVNGSIRVGEGAIAGNIDSVNGNTRLLPDSRTTGIRLVNGSLDAEKGTHIMGSAFLVNGTMELFGAMVDGDLETYSGNMLVTDSSKVAGNIFVKKPKGTFSNTDKPRIIIGPDSEVAGGIIAERDIHLFVHDSATVGSIEGAAAEAFSGSVSDID